MSVFIFICAVETLRSGRNYLFYGLQIRSPVIWGCEVMCNRRNILMPGNKFVQLL